MEHGKEFSKAVSYRVSVNENLWNQIKGKNLGWVYNSAHNIMEKSKDYFNFVIDLSIFMVPQKY